MYIHLEGIYKSSRRPYALGERTSLKVKSVELVDKFTMKYSSLEDLELQNAVFMPDDTELVVVTRKNENPIYQMTRKAIYDGDYPVLKAYIDASEDKVVKEQIRLALLEILKWLLTNKRILLELIDENNRVVKTNGITEIYALPLNKKMVDIIKEYYESNPFYISRETEYKMERNFQTYLSIRDFYVGIKKLTLKYPSLATRVDALDEKCKDILSTASPSLDENYDNDYRPKKENYREHNWDAYMHEERRIDNYTKNNDDNKTGDFNGRTYKLTPPKK